nr:C40 family peptidase [Nocardioides thalensis]
MSSVIDRSVAADVVQERLDEQRDDYLVAADEADAAEQEAEDTADDAAAAEDRAREAHAAAQSAADAAAAAAASIAGEKEELIRRLARLEGISIDLAEERQAALEAQRLEEEREQLEQEQQDEPDTDDPGDGADEPDAEVPDGDTGDDTDEPAPPADAGAAEAIAFARAQLGEPYVWGAEGPGSWDCSGLTMGAWAAGGIALPHYSVAQYQQSTPISVDDLRPGDLVFWSSSSSSSGIFHVALYTGDGMIIHAPRTGRPVTEESMYYWIPPTHFARP